MPCQSTRRSRKLCNLRKEQGRKIRSEVEEGEWWRGEEKDKEKDAMHALAVGIQPWGSCSASREAVNKGVALKKNWCTCSMRLKFPDWGNWSHSPSYMYQTKFTMTNDAANVSKCSLYHDIYLYLSFIARVNYKLMKHEKYHIERGG